MRGGESVADHVIGLGQAAAAWTMSRTARQQVRHYSGEPATSQQRLHGTTNL